ncbi:MAG: AMP-binding protein, partial [Arenibacterium sp.]
MQEAGNAAVYFVDRHLTEGRGSHPAFIEAAGRKRVMSYGELAEESGRVAAALQRAGIAREERAAMLVLDQLEFPPIFWGCLKAGVVPVPLNTLLASAVYDVILQDSRATCLFVSEELWEVAAPAIAKADQLRLVVVIGEKQPVNTQSFDAFMAGTEAMPAVDWSGEESALWLYSSGSTG